MLSKMCKDCLGEWCALQKQSTDDVKAPRARPAPFPGPRCATHWRTEVKRRKAVAHESRVQKEYGLSDGEYEALYLWQGGRCALCLRATGATRRLSVDHDHASGLVRGLLCRPCNSILGHARDSADFFSRAIRYLDYTPYSQLKGSLDDPAQER